MASKCARTNASQLVLPVLALALPQIATIARLDEADTEAIAVSADRQVRERVQLVRRQGAEAMGIAPHNLFC